MVRPFRRVTILIILFSLYLFNAQGQALQEGKTLYIKETLPLIKRQVERAEYQTRKYKLMDVLKIKPGMTVLDLGAGSGGYSYKFAERLKETGKVFATDINVNMINYINEQARARNLANLFPVLVNSKGVDEFYTKNKFDLIFLAHVYYGIHDRINYFKKLKYSLAKNGRLVILDCKFSQEFSLGDVSDFDGLIKQLSSEGPDSPFYLHFRESTQELLRRPLDDETKKLLRNVIIDEFNRIREDIYFLSNFLKNGLTFREGISFTTEERNFGNGLLRLFKLEDRALDDTGAVNITNVNGRTILLMKIINTILIVQEFRQYLYNGKPAPYLPRGYGNWKNNSTIQELSSAGYSLKHKYDFIPFRIILIFTPNKNTVESKN